MTVLEIGGEAYELDFRGFSRPLGFRAGDYRGQLKPWRLGQHLSALKRVGGRPLGEAWAGEVLLGCAGPELLQSELIPLALWWSAGGHQDLVELDSNHCLELSAGEVWLRPWTQRQRRDWIRQTVTDHRPTWPQLLQSLLQQSLMHCELPECRNDVYNLDSFDSACLLKAICGDRPLSKPTTGAARRQRVVVQIVPDEEPQ